MRHRLLALVAAGQIWALPGAEGAETNGEADAYFAPIYTGVGSPYWDSPESKTTFDKLCSIVLPEVDFDDEDINKVVDCLNAESKRHDPYHRGVSFRIWLPNGPVKRLSGPKWDVSIHLHQAHLFDVLNAIWDDDEIGWALEKGVVQLSPAEFPTLSVRSLSAQRAEKHFVRRLRSIVFPSLKIKDEDMAQFVAFLNEQSPRLDPQHIGVRIILQLPSASAVAGIDFEPYRSKITEMILQKVSVQDVLGYAVQQTNMEFRIEPDSESIIIKPISLRRGKPY